ncbi:MAG TPA: AAA family ATPase, partial [Leptospiraceae bacterium]|nr:AAA family ATPase [Leptospiraceae bacterium]
RFYWMKETFPDLDVYHLTDENPQFPEEDPNFWEIWKRSIRQFIKEPIDIVFTSEEYGEMLAKKLNARHICIDLERKTFPISGTQVRESPFKNWDLISDAAKSYFVKRIVIYGPESTGKTTLARTLAEYYKTEWVPEFAREYLENKNSPVELSDIPIIAEGQIRTEDELAKKANRILICDTDILVTKVYSEHYYNTCPEWIKEGAYNRKYALHLLTNNDIPWVADILRDRGDRREEMFELFKTELEKANKSYKLISGNYKERFDTAVQIIDELLGY